MNEIEFVDFLRKNFPFSRGIGIGDDASVTPIKGTKQLITTDILIENIHFRLSDISLEELALKSIAVNLSDIAAMGGIPQYFYLGLGFPHHFSRDELRTFFRGLKNGCRKWNLEMAGGDFSKSKILFVSITMVGVGKNPVYRHSAKSGDLIGITGRTGESALGLKLLSMGEEMNFWSRKHKRVNPQLKEGQILSRYVNSMIDISDGLIIDLKRVLYASGKGAHVYYEKMAVSTRLKKACFKFGINEYEVVLAGGEDYILLFTLSPENESKLRQKGLQYRIIGEVNSRKNELVISHHNKILRMKKEGYNHFE
jgi:thiamine-monophosphate kinase